MTWEVIDFTRPSPSGLVLVIAGATGGPLPEEDDMPAICTALRLDAVASGALGVLLIAFAGVLDGPLGLNVTLSVVVGVALLGLAGFVAWVTAGRRPALVLKVIALNVTWVAASLVFAVTGWGGLTGLGVVFVLAQAAAVAVLTVLQLASRRALRSAVAA